jgi:predicted aspartyl protease
MSQSTSEAPVRGRRGRAILLLLLLGFGLAGGLYGFYRFQNERFGSVYTQLGIETLPLWLSWQPSTQTDLDQLRREPCYRDAVVKLGNELIDAGYPREAATSLRSFATRCGNPRQVLPLAYEALRRVGDFAGALEVAKQLVDAAPENGTFRYWRAESYDQVGDFAHALDDYIASIGLVGNLQNVIGDAFYKLARTYDKLGRPCDAVAPIELYVSLDPAHRSTPQISKIISDYSIKGHCDLQHANGTTRIAFATGSDVHLVPVIVNGATGNFIVDTGASFVTITPQFAARAKVTADTGGQITLQTAGGKLVVALGHANSVAVGKAEAANVIVGISRSGENPFGSRIDGLLGMTFLSRFNVSLRPNGMELTAISLEHPADAGRSNQKGRSR